MEIATDFVSYAPLETGVMVGFILYILALIACVVLVPLIVRKTKIKLNTMLIVFGAAAVVSILFCCICALVINENEDSELDRAVEQIESGYGIEFSDAQESEMRHHINKARGYDDDTPWRLGRIWLSSSRADDMPTKSANMWCTLKMLPGSNAMAVKLYIEKNYDDISDLHEVSPAELQAFRDDSVAAVEGTNSDD